MSHIYAIHTHRAPRHISDWNTDHDEYAANAVEARGLFIAYAAQAADRYARAVNLTTEAEVAILQTIVATAETITDAPGTWSFTTEDGERDVTVNIRRPAFT